MSRTLSVLALSLATSLVPQSVSAKEVPSTEGISFEHPVLQEARITAKFGMRKDPFTQRPGWHGGMDLGAAWDADIFAPSKGEVVFAGKKAGYGTMVDLKISDGWILRFAHLKSVNVESGDLIESGTVLGYVGSNGRSSGPHLHFEARFDDKQYNPADLRNLQFYAIEKQRGG
ncbi:MAG: M23 family metallopeptidase [Henriciella sp.]